jgi:hypothetical protein
VGFSLVKYLKNAFPTDLTDHPCDFRLVASGELNGEAATALDKVVTLCLYRVTVNPYVRNSPHISANQQATLPLSVDLHYMLTVWSDNALFEHTVLGWAIRQLYQHQTLSQSDLSPDGGWGAGDFVQVIPSELSTEDMMRIWDALDPPYRLSVSYIARVIRIEADAQPATLSVVSRALQTGARGPAGGSR